MLFYPTILALIRFLTEDALTLKDDEQDKQVINFVDAWKKFWLYLSELCHEWADRFIVKCVHFKENKKDL